MRWYLKTQVISGTVAIQGKGRPEIFLNTKEDGSFHIINTEESRGMEFCQNQELMIEGRVKASSEGVRYLWVDRWWRLGDGKFSRTEKIS